jgi:hypothetical protein
MQIFLLGGKMRKKIYRFAGVLCFVLLIATPSYLTTKLSPEEAVSYIKAELSKKGLKNLTVKYGKIIDNNTQHNIFIELGARERTIQEVTDIWYESALIIGGLQPIMRSVRGMKKNPEFNIQTLRFTKKGKLACWIHSTYCAQAIWDDEIESSLEREQFILAHLKHER